MANSEMTDTEISIREKLLNQTYNLYSSPRVIYMDSFSTRVNKYAPNIDEVKSFEDYDWERDSVDCPKLTGDSCGEWEFKISMLKSAYFKSKEEFELLYVPYRIISNIDCCYYEKIPIEEAISILGLDISVNFDYYMKNREKLRADLGREISNDIIQDKTTRKSIEKELFYKQMVKLFGDSDNAVSLDTDGRLMIKNFRILYYDGNLNWAIAERGDHYLIMVYNFY